MSSQHNNLSEEMVSESARSSYRVAPGAVFTFDSIQDIEHKLLSTVRGLSCGAVYAVNFDEPEPVCSASAGVKAFPRLQAVINSIEESLNAFLALRNNTKVKLAVELDIADLLKSQLNAEAEQVAVATLFWMHKHGLERLALFVRSPGYSGTHMQRLVSLTKERSDLLPPHATDAVKTKRFCVSVSMAVHRFLVNEHNPSVANSTCFGETLVPYEQICLEGESTATYDAESMAVIKHDQ
ncbi:hypothetical protein MRX96_007868 [Rhipicephalus microplus]